MISAPFLERSQAAPYRFRRVASRIVYVAGGFFDVCFFSSFVGRKVRITAERYAEPRSKKKTMREGRV